MSEFDQSPVSTPSAAPSDNGAPSANPAIQDTNAAVPATPGTPAAVPTQQPTGGMVPSYRIRETREAVQRELESQYRSQMAEQQAKYDAMQRQLHAVVGVTPQEDPETSAIRQRFNQLFPGLAQLEARAQDLTGLLGQQQVFEQAAQHHWTVYSQNAMDRLFDRASKSLGGNLTDEGRRQLHAAFTGMLHMSPELQDRFGRDPKFVDEFWDNFSGAFVEPARRATGATIEQRTGQALPQDTPGGVPSPTPAPRPGSLEDRVAGAWASFKAAQGR